MLTSYCNYIIVSCCLQSGEVVKGKCGGYCGICSPSDGGLQLAIANYD